LSFLITLFSDVPEFTTTLGGPPIIAVFLRLHFEEFSSYNFRYISILMVYMFQA